MDKKVLAVAAIALVAVMLSSSLIAADNSSAADSDSKTYHVYVDLTADNTLNGEWIETTASSYVDAVSSACNSKYGEEKNSITDTGWITMIDGKTNAKWGDIPGYNWAQYYYDSDSSSWKSSSSMDEATDYIAVFYTEYLMYVTDTYAAPADNNTATYVLNNATYSGTLSSGYLAKAMTATATETNAADYTWSVSFAQCPTSMSDSILSKYVDQQGYYMMIDDTAVGDGLDIPSGNDNTMLYIAIAVIVIVIIAALAYYFLAAKKKSAR
ncbi:MAG: hypothetical protein WCS40_03080 [Methanomethylophilus sp.]